MDWTDQVDGYCERLGPGFWAEPFNALTNVAFIIAAAIAVYRYRRSGHFPPHDWAILFLIAVLVAIGIGSFLFHTLATRWAAVADVVPIMVFVFVYFWFALRRFFSAGIFASILWLGLLVLATYGLSAIVPRTIMGSGAGYLGPLAALLVVAVLLWLRGSPVAGRLGLASLVFAASLTFRTLDGPLCDVIPVGTHFIWHLLNATTLYILIAALIAAAARARSYAPSPST